MPQFLIPPQRTVGNRVVLLPDESHHVRDVYRKIVGQKLDLTDGQGNRFVGEIISSSPQGVEVHLLEKKAPEISKGVLKIGQALLKKDKMEWVVEKCVELGVETLLPFSSSRTMAHLEGDKKMERIQKIAQAATKQCERSTQMKIMAPTLFKNLIIQAKDDLKFIFWEEEGPPLRSFFENKNPSPVDHPPSVLALIGPEGGFAREEVEEAQRAGFHAVSLGHRILRAETAAIVAASLIQYELGNLK